jgi:hypothetical protein
MHSNAHCYAPIIIDAHKKSNDKFTLIFFGWFYLAFLHNQAALKQAFLAVFFYKMPKFYTSPLDLFKNFLHFSSWKCAFPRQDLQRADTFPGEGIGMQQGCAGYIAGAVPYGVHCRGRRLRRPVRHSD